MEANTIVLKYPVKMNAANGEETILTSVVVSRAKGRDLRNIPDGALVDDPKIATIALYCHIPYEAAEELDVEDIFEIMKLIPSLMPASSGTGEKSSGGSPEPTTSPQA